jgi:hypothetical protein
VQGRPAVQQGIVGCMTDDDRALFQDFEIDPRHPWYRTF